MERFRRIHDVIEETIPMLFFLSIFFVMTFGVLSRYVLGFYWSWNVEFSSYAFVWLTFVGSAYVRRMGSHIKIEIVYALIEPKLPPVVRMIIWIFKEIVIIAFLVLLVRFGYELSVRSVRFRSQAMQLSQYWLYISAAVGGFFFLLREIPDAVRQFRRGFDEPTTHIGL